ncbi:mandelate racemase/muconate lactonizing enzyme family protein [Halosimplex litoreum]|uniref:Mandelate racemase/muconate lactonizing enzyme family protein n=2 Tax=Halosimplex litoreum TaxID=1198301 RepID=A0A7U3WBR3_9EURY|nr:mandelate racemase/muconate lactonizing enzyme family protein [Halosimplex litoreum]
MDFTTDETHRPPERDLAITDVSTMVLQGNFPWGIVKVETDAGIVGYGEVHGDGPNDPGRLEGQNPLDIERVRDVMWEPGPGVEMALWDIKGKVLDVPVYELLGGKYRDAVRVYCDTHGGESLGEAQSGTVDPREVYTPESYAEAAREVVDAGFDALKFDLDVRTHADVDTAARRLDNAAIEHKASLVEAVREEIGYDVDLGFDLHWNFTVETATRLANELEPYDLGWLEDPVPPRKYDAHRRVREATSCPIMTGENLRDPGEFKEMLDAEGLDVAAPDPHNCGGLRDFRRIATLCDLEGVPIVAHNIQGPVGTVAAAHAAASVPNFVALEYHAFDVPWFEDLVSRTGEDGDVIEDGQIDLPEGPGLGIEIDFDVAERYLVDGEELV